MRSQSEVGPSLIEERPARPFLKWVGGKRQLIAKISERLPASFGRYHEPFVGGGALFFHLHPKRAFLSDRNERLVRAYKGIQRHVEEVIKLLKSYKHEKGFFLNLRKQEVDSGTDAEVAAWLIFLNKTGFNGLYRVNSHNQFNVPFGSNPRALICDENNLRQCQKALAKASIHAEDFSAVLRRAKAGDLVYFDPPYVPVSDTAYFTSYTSGKFGPSDQARLRDVALELKKREVFVILSNSSAPLVKELYSPKFTCVPVKATRVVNSKASGRGQVTELLIF
jgi:DNA adenine methylase